MPLTAVNGTTLYCEVRGRGAPLVFLPGLGCTHTMWEPQVEHFSRTHQVVTVDPRGVGQSGRLALGAPVLELHARDLAALLDELGIERAAVCGISFGGVLAQRFALDFSDRVAALAIADSFCDTRRASLGSTMQWLMLQATGWMWMLPTGAMMPMVRPRYRRWPLALRHLEAQIRNMRRVEATRVRYALNNVAYTDELRRLRCPVLGLVGDASRDQVRYMRTLVDAVPGAALKRIPDAMDPSNLCRPEEFNRLLARYLEEIDWG